MPVRSTVLLVGVAERIGRSLDAETSYAVRSVADVADAIDRLESVPVDCVVAGTTIDRGPLSTLVEAVTDGAENPPIVVLVDHTAPERGGIAIDRGATECLLVHDRVAVELERRLSRLVLERRRSGSAVEIPALFEHIPNPVVATEKRDGRAIVLAVNPAFEATFGFEEAAIVGQPINDVVVPPDEVDRATDISRRILAGEPVRETVRRRTADGVREFDFQAVITGGDGVQIYGIYRDVTEDRSRERRTTVLNRVLRHDLRNDTNTILGYARMLSDAELHEEQAEIVDAIIGTTEDLASKSEKARILHSVIQRDQPACHEINLSPAVNRIADRFRDDYPGATIDVTLPPDLTAVVSEDVDIAIGNALENAIVHADDPTVTVTGADQGDDVTLRITDNGPGVPDGELSVLERNQETPLEHLSGLGLWLMRVIVEESDGSLSVDSDADGTEVVMQFPASC